MSQNASDAVDVVVVGDPSRVHGLLTYSTAVPAATEKRFDSASDTWTVTTPDGQRHRGRILIDTTPGTDDVVAGHGMPNFFRIPGPHTERQGRYVARLLDGMRRGGSTRIEARSRVRVRPVLPTRGLSRFYLSGSGEPQGWDDETYDGPAVLSYRGQDYPTRVRLAGHFDPIDGRYHWQGMLYADLPGTTVTGSAVDIRIGKHSAAARISERTPWGTLAVVGAAGYPPFALADVEIELPPRR